jgi:hypothetical protein
MTMAPIQPNPIQPNNAAPTARRTGFRRLAHVVSTTLLTAALLLSGAWASFALWYQLPLADLGRGIGVAVWLAFVVAMLVTILRWRPFVASLLYALAFAGILVWWHGIQPRLDRDWAPDVARTVTGTLDGNIATLANVRNFDWQTPDQATERWETRSYDLSQLASLDIVLSYWGMDAIAHTLVSFGFSDGKQVVFSVEIRRQRTESFSEIGGFFKQFELAFIAADEADIVKLRTNIRREDVYIYPIAVSAADRQALFLAYIGAANDLAKKPSFYNTITANCTTVVFDLARMIEPSVPTDWRIVLSGYLPEYFAEHGVLAWAKPYGDLRARAAISARAQAAPDRPYSEVIRGR